MYWLGRIGTGMRV